MLHLCSSCKKILSNDGTMDLRVSHGYCRYCGLAAMEAFGLLKWWEKMELKVRRFFKTAIMGWFIIGCCLALFWFDVIAWGLRGFKFR